MLINCFVLFWDKKLQVLGLRKVVPYLREEIIRFLLSQRLFLRVVYVGFVVYKVALRQVFLQAVWFYLTPYHSTSALCSSVISCQYNRLASGCCTKGLSLTLLIHLRQNMQCCLPALFAPCIWAVSCSNYIPKINYYALYFHDLPESLHANTRMF
jgi:hypothetical protein